MSNEFNPIEWFAYGNDESKDLYARIDGKWFTINRHNAARLLPLSSIIADDMEASYQAKVEGRADD
jgi:hypothetical protein